MRKEVLKYQAIINELVSDLAQGKFDLIAKSNRNGRVNMHDVTRVIEEYGCTLIPLPEHGYDIIQLYPVRDKSETDMYIPLWTKEEGRSDLTLSVTVSERDGELEIGIDDLRVL